MRALHHSLVQPLLQRLLPRRGVLGRGRGVGGGLVRRGGGLSGQLLRGGGGAVGGDDLLGGGTQRARHGQRAALASSVWAEVQGRMGQGPGAAGRARAPGDVQVAPKMSKVEKR